MKKAVSLCVLVLCCCVAIGSLCTSSFFFGRELPVRNTMRTASSAALPSRGAAPSRETARPPLDTGDDALLLERAKEVLTSLSEEDYAALSQMVHPVKGVTFTPYSTVDPESDLCFLPDQIADAAEDKTRYLWGFRDGVGDQISLTIPEYICTYVYNADYLYAPEQAVDQVLAGGNALENVREIFPEDRFVECYFPGLRPEKEQFDWCSLKLVFSAYEEQWYLVGLIHSEWVI